MTRSIKNNNIKISAGRANNGQLLIELMVAMSVMVIGLLGIFAVLSQTIGLNKVASNQYAAANLASEGIEVVKNILDANTINNRPWNEGLSNNGSYGVQYNSTAVDPMLANKKLYYNPGTGRYSYDIGSGSKITNFRRIITLTNSQDEITVVSRVTWNDRGGTTFNTEAEDHFLDWRQEL